MSPYWIAVEPAESTVAAASIDLYGLAYCDACPQPEFAFGYCPDVLGPFETALDVSWTNATTGESGITYHGISGHCWCLFSYCTVSYSHRWLASVPLAMGPNEIEIRVAGPAGIPATDVVVITRVPPPPEDLRAQGGHGEVTLTWGAAPEATSYDVVWSTSPALDHPDAMRIADVTSPYVHTGLADDTTVHYAVTAWAAGYESPRSAPAWATVGWTSEDLPVPVGEWDPVDVSIATDSLGHSYVHVSRGLLPSLDIRNDLVTDATGAWLAEPIGPVSWWDADLAVDSEDGVHLSYMGLEGMTQATDEFGVWNPIVVDPAGWCDASIAMDARSASHLAYRAQGSWGEIRYATNASSAWIQEVVDAGESGCSPEASTVAIAVESDGTPHVIYRGVHPEYGLRYAVKRVTGWERSTIAPGYVYGMSIALDAGGTPYVVYSDQDVTLRLAHPAVSGEWTSETFTSEPTGLAPSLAIDAAASQHVSYVSSGQLRYATNASGAWRSLLLAKADPADTELALDPSGNVHIAWFEGGKVRHITNR